jgi:hypothetical protein
MGPPAARANSLEAVARTRKPYFAASRLPSFQSQTRTGTVAGRFPASRGQSQLRFASSGPHSPPRWRTRGRRCDLSLPCKKRATSGTCLASQLRLTMGPAPPIQAWPGCPLRFQPLGHTGRGVLAEPFNNNKKSGWGQRFLPHPGKYSVLLDRMQLPSPVLQGKIGLALVAQPVAGVVGNVHQRSGHAVQVHAFRELDTLGCRNTGQSFVLNLL